MNTTKMIRYYLVAATISLCLAACEKNDAIPGNGKEGYINFFNASEVLNQQAALSTNNMVIINDTLPGIRQPQFGGDGDDRQYPRTLTGTEFVTDNAGAGMFWMPLLADDYRLIYTSLNTVYLKDTTMAIAPKTFTTQYLVEGSEADDAYRIVTVPVETKGVEGKLRLQVVHLSPDFGPLEVYLSDAAGNRVNTELPKSQVFGTYSPYVELDISLANGTRRNFLLSFCRSGTGEPLATAAVPAVSNGVYTVVLRGFAVEARRRIKTTNTDYTMVTVMPNLRVAQRRIN